MMNSRTFLLLLGGFMVLAVVVIVVPGTLRSYDSEPVPAIELDDRADDRERADERMRGDAGRERRARRRAGARSSFARGGGRRASEGAGLGLAIVRAIAEAHGGRVELDSVPGRGCTFTLVLPRAIQMPAAPRPLIQGVPA